MLGSGLMIFFVMLVAAANLCVGYVAAVQLGIGPKTWPPKIDFGGPDPEDDDPPLADIVAAVTSIAMTPIREKTAGGEPIQEAAAEEPARDPLSGVLEQLARGFDRFEAELAHWDSRRREETLDADALTNSAIELNALAGGYLQQLQSSLAPLASQSLPGRAASAAREEVNACAAALEAQLNIVCAELGSLQFEGGDAPLAADKLTAALNDVLGLLYLARNRLEEPLATLLGAEVCEPALAVLLQENAHTSLLGRLCFEQVWQNTHTQRMSGEAGSVALIDLDGLSSLNHERGPLVARRVLQAVGNMLTEGVGPTTVVARLLGKQFVAVFPQQAPQAAAEMLEQLRQQVEQTLLRLGQVELRVTISVAVVIAAPEDEPSSVLERLRATIRDAKSSGRNRTLVWEGPTPTHVAPADVAVEDRIIDL